MLTTMNRPIISPLLVCSLISLGASMIGCDDAQEGLTPVTAGVSTGGEASGGSPAGSQAPLAGSIAGEVAGEPAGEVAGAPAGEVAGEVAGAPAGEVAGEVAGAPAGEVAGEVAGAPAGEVAGEIAGAPAGEVAGEVAGAPAGEVAGEVAGEIAGEIAGDMMGGDDIGEPTLIQGSVPADGVDTHSFNLSQRSGVRARTRGEGEVICPEDVDTVMELFKVTPTDRVSLGFNDDYELSAGHYCSEIIAELEPGEYEVEVGSFGGIAIESYVLELVFAPLLNEGDMCDPNDLSGGICPSETSCINQQCVTTGPIVSSVIATRADETLFLTVSGRDDGLSVIFYTVNLYDAMGELVSSSTSVLPDEAAPLLNQLPEIEFRSRLDVEGAERATEVEVIFETLESSQSDPLRALISPHPTLLGGSPCDLEEFTGRCEANYLCLEGDDMSTRCALGSPPQVADARLYARSGDLVASILGSDVERDIIKFGITLYNDQGVAILGGAGDARVELPIELSRFEDGAAPGYERYYVVFGADLVTQASAAELSLIDSTGLQSEVLLTLRAPLPTRASDALCDPRELDNRCAEGICYSNREGTSYCRVGLPTRGEVCDPEIGCEEGFVCYAPEVGGLQERFQTCMRACDDNAEPNGCAADELCLPDVDLAGQGIVDQPSPGVCLYSDQCVPGREAETCELNQASCLRVAQITLCVDLTGRLPAQVGDECFGLSNPCVEGSVCEAGRCRAACDDVGECAEGELCRHFDEVVYNDPSDQFKACIETCSPVDQDCEVEGQACVVFASESSEGGLNACQEAIQGVETDGATCVRDPDSSYWGDCEASNLCGAVFRDRPDLCIPLCTSDDSSPCTGDRVCDLSILDATEVGLCVGECNVFTDGGCEVNQACLLGTQGPLENGDIAIRGACYDRATPGVVTTGQTCVQDPLTRTNNCVSGHICADLTSSGSNQCVKLCQAESVEVMCDFPQSCINRLADGSALFGEDLSELGVCF